ncbi:TetR/AcrR family transcriptional regulator [Rhodococcus yananensis]|uniref:TetR/AcrR family transcriptional regulator n=1 Tax=Rhodococcus yananensis TaxID=2879464 RepID=UPI003EBF95EA
MRMSTGRLALLDAAEKLVARRGIHGVSSRDVLKEAGQRNNSAISYHFGSWHGLLDAIWSRHAPTINTERAALVAAAERDAPPTLDRLVHAYVHPLATQVHTSDPGYWARFNEQWLATAPLDALSPPASAARGADYYPSDESLDVLSALLVRIADELGPPEIAARRRVGLMVRFVIGAYAAYERAREDGDAPAPDLFEDEIIALACAMLRVPRVNR